MFGYVLRLTQGTERTFYCTQQHGGRYLAMFRRPEEITGAIAFLQEGQLVSLVPQSSPTHPLLWWGMKPTHPIGITSKSTNCCIGDCWGTRRLEARAW